MKTVIIILCIIMFPLCSQACFSWESTSEEEDSLKEAIKHFPIIIYLEPHITNE